MLKSLREISSWYFFFGNRNWIFVIVGSVVVVVVVVGSVVVIGVDVGSVSVVFVFDCWYQRVDVPIDVWILL